MKITADMKAAEALSSSKSVQDVFRKHNLFCAGCKGAGEDSLARVAVNHGLLLPAFLEELNAATGR
jgi:hypothetical protein